ncbi:MAG: plasmid pRiA4b ORF-3 family protein [Candidatus Paracaedibacter sp.]
MSQEGSLEVYQFQFFIKGISPMIWRRLLMTSNSSIADFHYAIQISMGWGDYHLNRFNIWGKDYGVYHDGGMNFSDNPNKVYLKDFQFRINEKFIYEYNFYDCWEHVIRLEKIVSFDPKKTYPLCVGGHYASIPEDSGGAEAFMKLMADNIPWRIEEQIREALQLYIEGKDRDLLEDTLKDLQYWETRHKFDRHKINRQFRKFFNHGEESQPTIEEVQDED